MLSRSVSAVLPEAASRGHNFTGQRLTYYEETISTLENPPQAAAWVFESELEQEWPRHLAKSAPSGAQAFDASLGPAHGRRHATTAPFWPRGADQTGTRFCARATGGRAAEHRLPGRKLAASARPCTCAIRCDHFQEGWQCGVTQPRATLAPGDISSPPARVGSPGRPRAGRSSFDYRQGFRCGRTGLFDGASQSGIVKTGVDVNPAQHSLIFCVRLYRLLISPAKLFLFGPMAHCRFDPTCSNYALEAVSRHGAIAGSWLALKRICHCHPWGGCGQDPVPGSRSKIAGSAPRLRTIQPGGKSWRSASRVLSSEAREAERRRQTEAPASMSNPLSAGSWRD